MTQEDDNNIEDIIGESLDIQQIFQEILDHFPGVEEGVSPERMIEEEMVQRMMIEGVSPKKIKESIKGEKDKTG